MVTRFRCYCLNMVQSFFEDSNPHYNLTMKTAIQLCACCSILYHHTEFGHKKLIVYIEKKTLLKTFLVELLCCWPRRQESNLVTWHWLIIIHQCKKFVSKWYGGSEGTIHKKLKITDRCKGWKTNKHMIPIYPTPWPCLGGVVVGKISLWVPQTSTHYP